MAKIAADAVLAAIDALPPTQVGADKLTAVREKLAEARDVELEMVVLGERLKQLSEKLKTIRETDLPNMFEAARIDTLGLEPQGNLPGYDAELKPYYHANLKPENMTEAFRQFRWLEPMQKHTFKVEFGRGEAKLAKKFLNSLKKQRLDYSNSVGVPWNTLTAEIRRRYEDGKPMSPAQLQTLGATVGRVVQLKQRKN